MSPTSRAPILALLPTESDCRDYMVSDIEPIFAATPALRGALADDVEEGGRNTLLTRRFPGGGSLKIVAARAPRNLRRHTARILIVDEADALREWALKAIRSSSPSAALSRSPIARSSSARRRSSPTRRTCCAPTAKATSACSSVPCPACGAFTEILWAHIVWPEDDPSRAAFACPHCKEMIDEQHKTTMVTAGRWRAMRPEVKGHAGFRLNALVSLLANASVGPAGAGISRLQKRSGRAASFSPTRSSAQGWSSPSMVDQSALAARAEDFDLEHIPPEVLFHHCRRRRAGRSSRSFDCRLDANQCLFGARAPYDLGKFHRHRHLGRA